MARAPIPGFFWWVGAVFQPVLAALGVVGGVVGLAALFQGIVEWNGPIAYVVHFWGHYISEPVRAAAFYAFGFRLDRWIADYLALAFIFINSYRRANRIIWKVMWEPRLRREQEQAPP